jgi:hypothetical protein
MLEDIKKLSSTKQDVTKKKKLVLSLQGGENLENPTPGYACRCAYSDPLNII